MRSPFPASNEVPAKQIASKHPTPPLSSGPLPDTPPRPRQFAASNPSPPAISDTPPRPSVYKPHPKHAQAPTSPSPALRASGNPPSVRQSSECPAVFRAPGNPPNAPPPFPAKRSPASPLRHARPPKSRTPPGIPKSPNSSRHPYTPIHSPDIPKHKKRSRHCAGSAPNYLQVSTRSYLSRSESGSGSCSSPYC